MHQVQNDPSAAGFSLAWKQARGRSPGSSQGTADANPDLRTCSRSNECERRLEAKWSAFHSCLERQGWRSQQELGRALIRGVVENLIICWVCSDSERQSHKEEPGNLFSRSCRWKRQNEWGLWEKGGKKGASQGFVVVVVLILEKVFNLVVLLSV